MKFLNGTDRSDYSSSAPPSAPPTALIVMQRSPDLSSLYPLEIVRSLISKAASLGFRR